MVSEHNNSGEDLGEVIENLAPSNYVQTLVRDRPYNGQPWTTNGERGKTLVEGLTVRDIRDCYIKACFEASGLARDEWPDSLYKLPWDDMDPMAVAQNLTCEIERMMGIFPNVPKMVDIWDHIPMVDLDAGAGETADDQREKGTGKY